MSQSRRPKSGDQVFADAETADARPEITVSSWLFSFHSVFPGSTFQLRTLAALYPLPFLKFVVRQVQE
eukprot:692437-Prymnesium_polylepis.1